MQIFGRNSLRIKYLQGVNFAKILHPGNLASTPPRGEGGAPFVVAVILNGVKDPDEIDLPKPLEPFNHGIHCSPWFIHARAKRELNYNILNTLR